MRLKGSLTEEHAREELSALQRGFSSHPQFEHIVRVVGECVPDAVSVRAWGWFPDNDDDVFILLVDETHLIQIEASQEPGAEPKVESVTTTSCGLKRRDQIKLAVALKQIPATKL